MVKKSHNIRVKAPFIEYHWYKEINKDDASIKFIEKQIDSFRLLVDNKNSINVSNFKEEIITFISIIPAQGHLIKLDKEYQKKFFEITKFIKDQEFGGIHIIPLRR